MKTLSKYILALLAAPFIGIGYAITFLFACVFIVGWLIIHLCIVSPILGMLYLSCKTVGFKVEANKVSNLERTINPWSYSKWNE